MELIQRRFLILPAILSLLLLHHAHANYQFLRFSATAGGPVLGMDVDPRASWSGHSSVWAAFWLFPRQVNYYVLGFGRSGAGWGIWVDSNNNFCIKTATVVVPITGFTVTQSAWNHYMFAADVNATHATVTIYKNAVFSTKTVVTGNFAGATINPIFNVAATENLFFTLGALGDPGADYNVGDIDLGPFWIGKAPKYIPNADELADMMRGRVDFFNPSLAFHADMRDQYLEFSLNTDVYFNGTLEVNNPLFSSWFDPQLNPTKQSWTCNLGGLDPWEQCDSSASNCASCQCAAGTLPDATGNCAAPRQITSAAVQIAVTANNTLPSTFAPIYNLKNGLSIGLWVSVSGTFSGQLPFFMMKSSTGGRSFGLCIDGAYNVSFCDANGARISYPQPLLNPYTFPTNTLTHIMLVTLPRYDPLDTQMPPYTVYINGAGVRNESFNDRSFLLDNAAMDSQWTLQWTPVLPVGATVRIIRPQLWADALDSEGIQAAMRGIQPTATSQDKNYVFLATDEGSGTTTLNIAKNKLQTVAAWVAASCDGASLNPWEQCDSGSLCVANKCVCGPGTPLSRTTRQCTPTPVIVANTTNFGLRANPLAITFDYSGTPSVVQVALDSGSCTPAAATAVSAGRWRTLCTFSATTLATPDQALIATLTVDGAISTPTQVAFVVRAPTVTPGTAKFASNATSVTFSGSSFGTVVADIQIVFVMDADQRTCIPVSVTNTQIRCTPLGFLFAGRDLRVQITRAGGADDNIDGVVIGRVVAPPTLTASVVSQAPTNRTLSLAGSFNIDPLYDGTNNVADYVVNLIFNNSATIGCTVSAVTATNLFCTATADLAVGPLRANISYFGGFSNTVQIRTVRNLPVITSSSPATIPVNTSTAIVAICGDNFGLLPIEHKVYLSREGGAGVTVASVDSVVGNCLFLGIASPPGRIFAVVEVLGVGRSNNYTITEAVVFPFLYSAADTVRRTVAERFTAPGGLTFLSGANLNPQVWTLETYIYNGNFSQDDISAGVINFTQIHLDGVGTSSRSFTGLTVLSNDYARCDFGFTTADYGKTVYGRIVSAAASNLPYEYITTIVPPPTVTPANRKMVETTFEISITGNGFNPTPGRNKAHFSLGGSVIVTQTADSGNPNNLVFVFPYNTFVGFTGVLSVSIETYGVNTTAAAIYTILPAPRINNSTQMTLSRGVTSFAIRGTNLPSGSDASGFAFVYFEEPSSGVGYSVSTDSNATHLILTSVTNLGVGPLQAAVVVFDGPNLKRSALVNPDLILVGLTYYKLGNVVPVANVTTRNAAFGVGVTTIGFRCTWCERSTDVRMTLRVAGLQDIIDPVITAASLVGTNEIEYVLTVNFTAAGDLRVRVEAYGAYSPETTIGVVTTAPTLPFEQAPDGAFVEPKAAGAPYNANLNPTDGSNVTGTNVGGIVAGVIVVIVVLIIAAVAVYFLVFRKRKTGVDVARASIPPRMEGDGGDAASPWDQEELDGGDVAPDGGDE
eukprot:TRINITY_DN1683_c0_g1_i1.p1 TRINITY_DN1683_c0_g1~~TRINITY_DN1683_c0_g1_i1.p1  ORF type:complete len:1525 (+),score=363.14 TRINITY_DN1683_c0_g1_i1:123-4577(+)